jgi:hypothetical protein
MAILVVACIFNNKEVLTLFVTAIFVVFLIIATISMLILIIRVIRTGVLYLRKSVVTPVIRGMKRNVVVLLAAGVMCVVFSVLTQLTASTPAILGDNAISELRMVELNGRGEWISLRGHDKSKPILLFLAGGAN